MISVSGGWDQGDARAIAAALADRGCSKADVERFTDALGKAVAGMYGVCLMWGAFDQDATFGPKANAKALRAAAAALTKAHNLIAGVTLEGREAFSLVQSASEATPPGSALQQWFATCANVAIAATDASEAAARCEALDNGGRAGPASAEKKLKEALAGLLIARLDADLNLAPVSNDGEYTHQLFKICCSAAGLSTGGDWFDYFTAGKMTAAALRQADAMGIGDSID